MFVVRVVADTNIYISAFNFGGPTGEVIELAQNGRITLFVSPAILHEIKRILSTKFYWADKRIDEAISNLLQFAHLVYPTDQLNDIIEDPDDNRILECAVEAGAVFIVSGDRHLLKLKSYRDIQIVPPAEFIVFDS